MIKFFAAVIIIYNLSTVNCAPRRDAKNLIMGGRLIPIGNINMAYQPQSRQLFDPLSWLQSLGWIPIEVNVPDALSSIGQGISNIGSNIGQGFPFFNRLVSNIRPKPLRYFMLMPLPNQPSNSNLNFNPFESEANNFPFYP